MILDLSRKGLLVYFKPLELEAIRYVWSQLDTDARSVYNALKGTPSEMSRGSVIKLLNRTAGEGFLDYNDVKCKGGWRRVFSTNADYGGEESFTVLLIDRVLNRLCEEFPIEGIDMRWA